MQTCNLLICPCSCLLHLYESLFLVILAEDSDVAVKSKPIPAITMPQLPPEPTGRCSNKLQVILFTDLQNVFCCPLKVKID